MTRSPNRDCKYNRITHFECRRVVALAVVETATIVCQNIYAFTFDRDKKCSFARLGDVYVDHRNSTNIWGL